MISAFLTVSPILSLPPEAQGHFGVGSVVDCPGRASSSFAHPFATAVLVGVVKALDLHPTHSGTECSRSHVTRGEVGTGRC